jgi:transcriptional regulator with XRE-family HTH domain
MLAAVTHSGKTQREIAKIMEISEAYLGTIIHGKNHPKKHLSNLAQILGVSLEIGRAHV